MANMGYCRFQNTLKDLKDCYEHIEDDNLSAPESLAQNRLITLCRQIAALFDDEADDAFDELESQLADANRTITNMAADNRRLQQRLAELEGALHSEGCKP